MRHVTDAEKHDMWESVRQEFPDDDTMQQVHFVRLLHQRQLEGLPLAERVRFYEDARQRAGL